MATKALDTHEERLVTHADWEGYKAIRKALEHTRIRLTYDRGRLEFLAPSSRHEKVKSLLGSMLEFTMVEFDIRFEFGGSMTFQREDIERGLEPDECYWVQSWKSVTGRDDYDSKTDPPPDLVLEVDITSSSANRVEIYRHMGVRELWRYSASQGLEFLSLSGGEYHKVEQSPTVPQLTSVEVSSFLDLREELSAQQVLKRFRSLLGEKRS